MTSPTWPPGGTNPPPPPGPTGGPPPWNAPSTWGTPPGVRSAPTVTRWGDAILLAVASAFVGGLAWWAVVAYTKTQFVYGAIGVGILVGAATRLGARRNGIGAAVIAAVCTLVSLTVAEYFVQRTLAINDGLAGIPLWDGFGFFRDVIESGVEENPLTAVFWLLAAGAAGFSAYRS